MKKLPPKTPLAKIAEDQYFPLNLQILSPDTRYQYNVAFRAFAEFLERPATLADLNDDTLTLWIRREVDRKHLALTTIRERVGRIKALWTWLAKRQTVATFPTFASPRPVESQPKALTDEQLRRLFRSAAKERGEIGGIPAALWWMSFLAFVWNTAERKSAALAVRVEWFDLSRQLCVIPPEVRKGKRKWATYKIWPETMPLIYQAIECDPARELMWPFPHCAGSYYTRYDRILREAGIPVDRKHKTHSLRVTHATVRTVLGGDATRALLHSDRSTTERHYIDPAALPDDGVKMPLPWQQPALGYAPMLVDQQAKPKAARPAGKVAAVVRPAGMGEVDPSLAWL
jgi:integrase